MPWYDRHINRRAPAGGECSFTERFYRGGEWEPFYVPRLIMSQVDFEDYPGLLQFADDRGVECTEVLASPELIKPHQRINHDMARRMAEEELKKPIIISREPYILDGHHRWWEHNHQKKIVHAYQFHLEFEESVAFLFSFPKTYAYGDGQQHEISM